MISHYPALNYLKISHFPPHFMYHFHIFHYLLIWILTTKKNLYIRDILFYRIFVIKSALYEKASHPPAGSPDIRCLLLRNIR